MHRCSIMLQKCVCNYFLLVLICALNVKCYIATVKHTYMHIYTCLYMHVIFCTVVKVYTCRSVLVCVEIQRFSSMSGNRGCKTRTRNATLPTHVPAAKCHVLPLFNPHNNNHGTSVTSLPLPCFPVARPLCLRLLRHVTALEKPCKASVCL